MSYLRLAILSALGSFLLWSFEAVADDCVAQTAAQRVSWTDLVQRRLHNHDPGHAAQMSRVASEIINGEVDALKSDIDSGLNSNAVLKLGDKAVSDMSLLTLAAAACQPGIAEQLLAAGASVDGVGDSPPLVAAAASGATSLVTLFIQHGARIDKVDVNGHTALEDAVRQRHLSTVQFLLAHGSDPNRAVGGAAAMLDLVAHSSAPIDQAIATELRVHGAGAALTSTQ